MGLGLLSARGHGLVKRQIWLSFVAKMKCAPNNVTVRKPFELLFLPSSLPLNEIVSDRSPKR